MHDIDHTQLEYQGEMEAFEFSGEGGVFNESDELELAGQLLEVQDEDELDQFLGDLIKKAGRAAGRFISSPTGQALGGILKSAARQALPVVGSALGGYIGGAGGAKAGGQLAAAAGKAFGLELEGEGELETARNFVRMAAQAVQNATAAAPGTDPRTAARAAVVQAAKVYAPALLRATAAPAATGASPARPAGVRGHAGRWIRRGSKIVLLGV
jgi:hypothetical protein